MILMKNDLRTIPIVMASDNNYVPYMSVALASIKEHASDKYNYEIYILSREISEINQKRLANQFLNSDNFSVTIIDVNKYINNLKLQISQYYSIEIYFRALIPEILSSYSKAIYLDCDLVSVCDIAELWETDIGDAYLGAIRDVGMILHYYTSGRRYIP